MTKIFLDLDGVMADFEGHFLNEFGFAHNSIDDKTMWLHIDGHPQFFRDLPLMEDAMVLFDHIVKVTGELPFVLTACPRTNYQKHAIDKINWVHEHLHKKIHVLPVMGGKNKCLFMKNTGDILIDDFIKNLGPWQNRGGRVILHRKVQNTIINLNNMLVSTN